MLEKQIEAYLRDEVKKIGGKALKFISPGNSGVPDRIILLPKGKIYFVETKSEGEEPTPLQKNWIVKLHGLGFFATCIDRKSEVDVFIDKVNRGML